MISKKSCDTAQANFLQEELQGFLDHVRAHCYHITDIMRGTGDNPDKLFFESDAWPGWTYSDEWNNDRPLPGRLSIAYQGSVLWTLSYCSSLVPVR